MRRGLPPLALLLPLMLAAIASALGATPLGGRDEGPEPPREAAHGGTLAPPLLPSPRPALITGELQTPRFRLLHTRRSEGAARELADRIEQARDGLQFFLGRDWPGVTEVRVGADREEMRALAIPGGHPPSWAMALAYPAHNVILLDASTLSGPGGVDTVWHELAHIALGRLGEGWPRWFQEGLAVHLTGERFDTGRYTTLFRAVHSERVMAFADLSRAWPDQTHDVQIAYAQSAAFVGWLSERHGSAGMARLVDAVGGGDPFETAFAKAFRTTLTLEEEAFRDELPSRYGWVPVASTGTAVMGLAALTCVWAWTRRRRQLALRLAEMEAQEAAEEAARRLLEAELQAQEDLLARFWNEPHGWPGFGEDPESSREDDGTPQKPTLH